MKKMSVVLVLMMSLTRIVPIQAQTAQSFEERLAGFAPILEDMRQELKIPGMSAALVKDRELVWARGFGYADLENSTEAGVDTAYFLASLTKTFASTILMQLVEQGNLELDDPVSKYGVRIKSPGTISDPPAAEGNLSTALQDRRRSLLRSLEQHSSGSAVLGHLPVPCRSILTP